MKSIERCKADDIDEVWLGGDIIEYVNKYAVGEQDISIKKQIAEIVVLLIPIKDKITKVIYGNHEQRAMRNRDLEPTELICYKLGIRDKYKESNVIHEMFNGFKVYFEHPIKGGANSTSYLTGTFAKRMAVNHDAEVYIFPHFHKHIHTVLNKMAMDQKTRIPTYFIYEGGYVEYWGSFGHTKHAEVSRLGSHMITFDSKTHTIEVEDL